MPLSLERSCVEAVFFVALAVATAVLHYARGFSWAFAGLSSFSSPAATAAAASAANGPLYNYVGLLAAASAAYLTARTAASFAAALPSSSSPPSWAAKTAVARRAAVTLGLPAAVALICYVGAGYPPLGGSVAAGWLSANWERNGERDLRWCGRLFALLFCWQAALAAVVAASRALAGGVLRQARRVWSGAPEGKTGGSSSSSSSKGERSAVGDGGSAAAASGGEKKEGPGSEREDGAPGWGDSGEGGRERGGAGR